MCRAGTRCLAEGVTVHARRPELDRVSALRPEPGDLAALSPAPTAARTPGGPGRPGRSRRADIQGQGGGRSFAPAFSARPAARGAEPVSGLSPRPPGGPRQLAASHRGGRVLGKPGPGQGPRCRRAAVRERAQSSAGAERGSGAGRGRTARREAGRAAGAADPPSASGGGAPRLCLPGCASGHLPGSARSWHPLRR